MSWGFTARLLNLLLLLAGRRHRNISDMSGQDTGRGIICPLLLLICFSSALAAGLFPEQLRQSDSRNQGVTTLRKYKSRHQMCLCRKGKILPWVPAASLLTELHLQDVQSTQLGPAPFLRAVHLRPLDDDSVSREVHTPGQCGCGDQHLQEQNSNQNQAEASS